MKRIFALLILLAAFASAQTDSTDILITVREDGDTTQVGRWRAGMPVIIRASWDGWGEREKQGNKFVIVRVGIAKARIDSFLVNHTDSTTGLRRKYQLSRAAIQFVKNNRDANNVVRVTPAQLRNAFKRANRLRRFGEPQRMSIIPDRLYIRWRNMLIGATPTSATVNTDGGGDYTSLAAAEAGEQKDLETANEQLTISCSGTTADVTAVVFDGWTTDATRNVIIRGENNSGLFDATKYRIKPAIDASGLICSLNYTTIKYIYVDLESSITAVQYGIYASGNFSIIENCFVKYDNSGYGSKIGIKSNTSGSKIINCVAINVIGSNSKGFDINSAFGNTIRIYNCIAYNCTFGFYTKYEYHYVINSIAQNCTDGFYSQVGFAADSDYNISDIAGDAPGANSLNSTTVNFADAANGDFRLLAGSPGIDQGVDLSADPNYAFNTDIIGTVRPQGSAWDIGAFEYVQPATTNNDKKSRYKGFGTAFKGGWKK